MDKSPLTAFGAVLLMMSVLNGCDGSENKELTAPAPAAQAVSTAPAQSSAPPTPASPSPSPSSSLATEPEPAQRDKLTAQTAGKTLSILDVSELQLDGANALVLTFSIPLDPEQDFARVVHLVDKKSGKVDGSWELAPNQKELRLRHLEPQRELVVSVDRSLKALNKATLDVDWQKDIVTRDIQPTVGFASRGSLLPTRVVPGLPVIALNVQSIDVNFFRVKQASLAAFISRWEYRNSMSNWDAEELLNMAELAYTGRFDLNPQRNTRENMLLPLGDIKQLQQPGVYFAVMERAGEYNYSHAATLFTLSDIGLSVHKYQGRIDFFSQSLENGKAQSDIEVLMLDQKGQTLASVTTDSDGHAVIENPKPATLILARKGDQATLLDFSLPALDLGGFDISGGVGYHKQFFMFGPRDLYRPGETIILNALLRDADGKPLPEQPVKLDVVKPNGTVASTEVVKPQNGFYQFTWKLPEGAETGMWRVRANTGDNLARNWDFNVEDFMPERMALTINTAQAPFAMSDEVDFDITGRYLYGAPAAGNSLQGKLFLRPMRDAVAALPGFEFGDITEESLSRTLDEFEVELSESGKVTLSTESEWKNTHSPLRLILQASLLESGGRPVTRRAEQAIWPAEELAGIRPQFAVKDVYDYTRHKMVKRPMVNEDSNAWFDIVYATPQGEKHAVSGLKVRLVRERRDYYWDWSEGGGWNSRYDQKDLVEAEQFLDLAAGEIGKVSFPVTWGSYRLEVITPDETVSSVRFWAGYNWQENSDSMGATRPDSVALKIDKPGYKPGDTIKLHISAPVAGKGYAMVESAEGPLWWKEIDVPTQGLDISIPVDKKWNRHDLYLSTLVVRQGDKSQAIMPKRTVGLLHLPMADETRRLSITLDAPQKIRPGQTLSVKVKAQVKEGKVPEQINMLLSAVDSGVLNITEYVTPDPWQGFFGRKRYGADIYDIYGQVIEGQGRLASLRFGGDGDELLRGGKPPVNHVKIVAQQMQPIKLDANGEGSIELPVGDFNGELRLMAQAWTDDKFGSNESKVIVAAPLVSELNTPRFMAGGDVSRLAFDLTNLTEKDQKLKVNFTAAGLVALQGAVAHEVTLKPKARSTLFVSVRAKEGYGDGEVAVSITGLNLPGEELKTESQQWKIGVRPAFATHAISSGALLQAGETWHSPASNTEGFSLPTLQGKLQLSGTPPLNLARYIHELKAYPYGCLEQTTSGIYPSLYTNAAQLKTLGINGDSDEKRRELIDRGISRLLNMQRDNGGFSLWDNSGPEEYWLTAYVTDFLVRASEQGYNVPANVINDANSRLLRYLQDPGLIALQYSSDTQASKFSVQAYAGLVLARQQKAPLGALRDVWARRDAARSGLALVQLGVALKLMGDEPRSKQALRAGIDTRRITERWLGDYGSQLRDEALILSLLEEYKLLPDERSGLLYRLSEDAYGKSWLSTQENNALYLAARNITNMSAPWQAQTTLAEQIIGGNKSLTRNLNASEISALEITNSGGQPLWVRLDSMGYPQQAPSPTSDVLHIERVYMDTEGNRRSLSSLKSGELVLVWLDIWADKPVPDALVVDLLPAGLELENQNLANSSASLGDNVGKVQELLKRMQQQDIQHMEFRDDRFVAALRVDKYDHSTVLYLARAVTPGEYTVPQPLVESMYLPAWRATGAAGGRLTITP